MYEESEAQRRRLINCIIFKTLHFGAQPCKILILMRAPLLPFENVIAIICTPTIRRVTIAASLYENKNHQPDLLSSFQIKFIWPWNICTGRTFFPGCASCVSQGCLLPHAEAPPLTGLLPLAGLLPYAQVFLALRVYSIPPHHFPF